MKIEGKEALKKLEAMLAYGDKAKIAAKVGVNEVSVTRFFKGTKGPNYTKILNAAIEVAKNHQVSEQSLTELLGQ